MAAAGHAPRAEETAEHASEGANAQAGTGKPAWRARARGSCASAAARRATHLLPHPRAARAHPRLPAREATAAACERPWQSPGRGGEWAEQPHLESAAAPHGRTCAQRCRLPPPAAAHRPPGGGWQRRRGSRPRGRSPGWPTWGRRSENAQRSRGSAVNSTTGEVLCETRLAPALAARGGNGQPGSRLGRWRLLVAAPALRQGPCEGKLEASSHSGWRGVTGGGGSGRTAGAGFARLPRRTRHPWAKCCGA